MTPFIVILFNELQ